MPFIGSQGQSNAGFQKGWNMIMSLYGQKKVEERAEQQQSQFDERMGQAEKDFGLREKRFAEDEKRWGREKEIYERDKKAWSDANTKKQKYLAKREAAKAVGELTPKKDMEMWREFNVGNTDFDVSKTYPKAEKTEKGPSAIQEFEIATFGGPNPKKRGTASYRAQYLSWIKSKKEQSTYVPAFIEAQERKIRADAIKEGGKLRTEFNAQPEVKQFTEFRLRNDVMKRAMKKAESVELLKKGSNIATDQAIITTFNKMTDPDSVVRESEYARTGTDQAVIWDRVKGKVEKWMRGGAGLTIQSRREMAYMANQFYEVAEGKYFERLYEYQGYVKNYGLESEKHIATPKWAKQKLADRALLKQMEGME